MTSPPSADESKPLTIEPEILADILSEARTLAEEVEAYVSEQLRDEMNRHDFDAPDDAESGMVFTFGHYRKLGRIVRLLADLSLSYAPRKD